jgi:uncharacterized YigZ family protein
MDSDEYLTIAAPSQGLFKDRKSRFVGLAFPVSNDDEVKELLKKIKKEYYDAAHHCYAYVIGAKRDIFRSNDDGEPAGGTPILGQINTRQLTNILVVVVRYYGGVKLGVPGLINAFRTATSDALENAETISEFEKSKLEIYFKYVQMNPVMSVLKEDGVEISEQKFELDCMIKVLVRVSILEKIMKLLKKIEGVKVNLT